MPEIAHKDYSVGRQLQLVVRYGLWKGHRLPHDRSLLRRAPTPPIPAAMAEEALNHRIHLVMHLKLVEVAGTEGLAIHDGRQPLRHEIQRIERRCRCQVERWHFALRRNGRAVVRVVPPHGAGGHMAQHRQHVFQQLLVGGGQEQSVRDKLPLGWLGCLPGWPPHDRGGRRPVIRPQGRPCCDRQPPPCRDPFDR